jgi:dTMP kinase
VGGLSRRRWFELSIVLAGAAVASLSVAPLLAGAALGAFVVGAGAGMAFLAGITLLGGGVTDEVRGRVFAFVQTAVRGHSHRHDIGIERAGRPWLVAAPSPRPVGGGHSTTRVLLLVAGACGVLVSVAAFRQMDDRPGVPVLPDLLSALRRRPPHAPAGRYIVIDGPAGAATPQAVSLAAWLHELGRDVVLTGSTTVTTIGRRSRGAIVIVNASRDQLPSAGPPPGEGPGTHKPDLVVRLDPRQSAHVSST